MAYRHEKESGRQRDGQPGHKGCSNNDPAEALFAVPRPEECPDCRVGLDGAGSGTARRWLGPCRWMLGLEAVNERAAGILRRSEVLAGRGAAGGRAGNAAPAGASRMQVAPGRVRQVEMARGRDRPGGGDGWPP